MTSNSSSTTNSSPIIPSAPETSEKQNSEVSQSTSTIPAVLSEQAQKIYHIANEQFHKLQEVASHPTVTVQHLIQAVKEKLGKRWEQTFEQPVHEIWNYLHSFVPTTTTSSLSQLSVASVYNGSKQLVQNVVDGAKGRVVGTYQFALDKLDATVDKFIPQTAEEKAEQKEEKDEVQLAAERAASVNSQQSLREVGGKIKKRLSGHAYAGYEQLSKFSSESVAPRIGGYDPVAIGSSIVASGLGVVSSKASASQQAVHDTITRVRTQIDNIQNSLSSTTSSAVQTVKQTGNGLLEKAHVNDIATKAAQTAHLENLQTKLTGLKNAVVGLTQTSADYGLHREFGKLPADLVNLSRSLLSATPSLLVGKASFNGIEDETKILSKVEELQNSLRELLGFWNENTTTEEKQENKQETVQEEGEAAAKQKSAVVDSKTNNKSNKPKSTSNADVHVVVEPTFHHDDESSSNKTNDELKSVSKEEDHSKKDQTDEHNQQSNQEGNSHKAENGQQQQHQKQNQHKKKSGKRK